jgi:hypothetical protein
MGIFYNPPLPPTANNAGTPPEPHVPIGNQGTSVPPRRAIAFAATMAILVSSWPADLEPRLQRPNDQQTKIAPLTLRYGSQPPQIPALAIQELTPDRRLVAGDLERAAGAEEPRVAVSRSPRILRARGSRRPSGRHGNPRPYRRRARLRSPR